MFLRGPSDFSLNGDLIEISQRRLMPAGIGPFLHHSICLNISPDMAVLYGNGAFLILLLSTKKRYSSFLKRIYVFQKICFKFKVLKTFKTSNDCHIKTCRYRKRRGYFEEPMLFPLVLKCNL